MDRDRERRNQRGATVRKELDEESRNNPILCAFDTYARELDDKHDRHERLVKLSRDTTIESKRIIFLLHTIDVRRKNGAKVLDEVNQRLTKLIEQNFKAIAKELKGLDPYQYRNAFSPGLQEFIEAYTFYEYFKSCEGTGDENGVSISDWKALQSRMQYEDVPASTKSGVSNEENKEPTTVVAKCDKYGFFVDPNEFILGLSDLTGELMRRCINSLGSRETNVCLDTCKILQQFYTAYIGLNYKRSRELLRKISTMRQSLLKVENVCYIIKVHGCEAANRGAMLEPKPADDVDEGFFA